EHGGGNRCQTEKCNKGAQGKNENKVFACTEHGGGVKTTLIKRLNEASAAGASTKRSIDEVEGDVEEAPAAKKAVVEETVGFEKLRVAELRAECTKRGLDTKGVKAALVKKLRDWVEEEEEEEAMERARSLGS
ncbi:hypothetical protein TrRE_jg6934, partial [Triparma retinervis]